MASGGSARAEEKPQPSSSGWAQAQSGLCAEAIARAEQKWKLPPGLLQCQKLPAPIFTPATKEQSGHDVNVSFDEAACLERMTRNRYVSGVAIYHSARLQLAVTLGALELAWEALGAAEGIG